MELYCKAILPDFSPVDGLVVVAIKSGNIRQIPRTRYFLKVCDQNKGHLENGCFFAAVMYLDFFELPGPNDLASRTITKIHKNGGCLLFGG